MIAEGMVLERFHAADDRQVVRDRVFTCLTSQPDAFAFDTLILDKKTVPSEERPGQRFYPLYATQLLRTVLTHYPDPCEPIVIVTDRLPIKRDQATAAKLFKRYIRQHLGHRSFALVHHASTAHGALQAADYCIWATYRKWTRDDDRSYRQIQSFHRSEMVAGTILSAADQEGARNSDPPSYPAADCAEEPHGLLLPGGDLFS